MNPPRRLRNDAGSALVELTWLAVVLLIPLAWLVASVGEVQRGAFGVTAAARSAARAYSLAPDDRVGAARAEAAARVALTDQGLGSAPVDLRVRCTPVPHDCTAATSVITVRVETAVPLPMLPSILGREPAFRLDATHTVPVGQFRESR